MGMVRRAQSPGWFLMYVVGRQGELAEGPAVGRAVSFQRRLEPASGGGTTARPWQPPIPSVSPAGLVFNPGPSWWKGQLSVPLSQGVPGGVHGHQLTHHFQPPSSEDQGRASSPNSPAQDQQKKGVRIKWRERAKDGRHISRQYCFDCRQHT